MTRDYDSMWIDRRMLNGAQYRTDANLAARQSIYAYQQPAVGLSRLVLDLAGLHGHEAVADIGCGNGVYLAELARRGHAGPVLGADQSAVGLSAGPPGDLFAMTRNPYCGGYTSIWKSARRDTNRLGGPIYRGIRSCILSCLASPIRDLPRWMCVVIVQ